MALEKSKSLEADLNLQIGYEIAEEAEKPMQTPIKTHEEPTTFYQKTKWIFTNITVEPIMVCYVLPSVMASLAVQNLSLEKACRVNLGFSNETCDAMTIRNASAYNISEEEAIQKMVATMNAYKNIIQSLLPTLLLMFLGSWSDRHCRRKPCILLPLFGEIASCTGFILCTYFFYQLPMEFNMMAEAVPPALTGGWFCMFMGVFSYISGISSVDTRTLRIGAVNMFSNVSISIGIALSGILYRKIGYYGVFSLGLAMYTSGVIYGLIKVKEVPKTVNVEDGVDTIQEKIVETKKKNFLVDFFDPQHIKETFKVAFKQGKRNRRKRICIIMILVMVIIGPMHGEMNVMYLFVRYKFGWNEMDYSVYSTFNFCAHMIGAIVEMLNGTSFIAMRSITSKLVPPEELGKINSLFGVSEALMPLVYGPMYSYVYKRTIDTVPGSFLLLGGFLTTPAILIFLWLYKEHKNDAKEDAKEKALNEGLLSQKQLQAKFPKEETIETPPVPSSKPRSVPCSVCGRLFGTKSIKFHEPQCLKKWHLQNDHLPPNEREPMYRDTVKESPQISDGAASTPEPEKSASSTRKPPMFPCYLCGRLFSVNSIYIHEPQCLKKWRAENDKLPPNKRRQEPLKPDIKFTPDGKIDHRATSEANWLSHLEQLVPCRNCGRTFNPDRVGIHEKSCKGQNFKRMQQDIKVEILE
ncbi:MFS transporter [Holotrichia oblita]|uniref:MFS transporter n=1 Tax=Holotrichia oblita TaxID=644536 RepID=A0ACB9TJC5_HOLOL|nr:MFS transporter [Holotrichia oblita]